MGADNIKTIVEQLLEGQWADLADSVADWSPSTKHTDARDLIHFLALSLKSPPDVDDARALWERRQHDWNPRSILYFLGLQIAGPGQRDNANYTALRCLYFEVSQQHAEASRQMQLATETHKNSATVWSLRGLLSPDSDHKTECFTTAILIDENFVPALFYLAETHANAERYHRAKALLHKVITTYAGHVESRILLSEVCEKLGQREEAVSHLHTISKLVAVDDRRTKRVRSVLESLKGADRPQEAVKSNAA